MDNLYLGAVNRQLHYAGLLLAEHKRVQSKSLCAALLEGALYQLEGAYRHHLRELAVNYQCQGVTTIVDIDTLLRTLSETGKTPAEAQEMKDLEISSGTWLAQMLAAHRGLSAVDALPGKSDSTLIQARQLDGTRDFSAVDLVGWAAALEEMVGRHRDLMYEC